MRRIFRHLITDYWSVRRAFPGTTLQAIEEAIAAGERSHLGELRFVVESSLSLVLLLRGTDSRSRAVHLFGELGVWDTEDNSGVLIYVLLADRRVEIVADRGIHRRVGDGAWVEICHAMQDSFRARRFRAGALEGIAAVSALLAKHFPADRSNPDELSNRPIVMG
ncbi:MAG: TPM domain-containing protein [Burkholderiales bacterium]